MVYGKKVLDLFCYTGAFSLYAARGNAASVFGIDTSARAIELARKNADLNKNGTVRFECTNAFDFLRNDKQLYDLIVLDPPSFTRSKKGLADARRGYKELNLRAMRKLKKGGILVTTCCSYHVSTEVFVEILQRAERDSGVVLRIVGRGGQSLDHPVLLAMPETNYLKCFFLQRV
jgi:23S rRNA (cytosine1962-C5)-methyltransferase